MKTNTNRSLFLFASFSVLGTCISYSEQSRSANITNSVQLNTKISPKKTRSSTEIKSPLVGTVKTGIMAIGGETTGILFRAKDGKTIELDFAELKMNDQQINALDGKTIEVLGTLKKISGVEIKERLVLMVSSYKQK